MRAIRVHETGGPEALRLDELPDPKPSSNEVLVDIEATGINFIEIYQRKGLYPLPLPLALGAEGAGTVRAIGTGVTDIAVGDRVVSQRFKGSYADRAVSAADQVVRIPDGVSSKQ